MNNHALIVPGTSQTFTVKPEKVGLRLDVFLIEQFPNYSRSFFSRIIDDKLVKINGTIAKKGGLTLKAGDIIHITFPLVEKDIPRNAAILKNTGLTVIHQEPSFAIIYKPAGITVHPVSEKSPEPTLVDWLLMTFSDVVSIGYKDRPGIVHRLDKETSGLMIIPLTAPAFATFSGFFKDRKIHKTYLAIVKGYPEKEGLISYPIGRHQTVRNKMTYHTQGRTAITPFITLSYLTNHALVEARPITGRTHQIRVHFATSGHPLVGDKLYGNTSTLIGRHALHAYALQFTFQGKEYYFSSPLPEDMELLLKQLAK